MKLSDRLINFQNRAEAAYNKEKNVITVIKYACAYALFMMSTLFAALTLPIRFIFKKLFKKKQVMALHIGTNKNIDALLKNEALVLIDFWAEWCGPCLMMNPILDRFSKSTDQVNIIKVNADFNMDTLKNFKVTGLPHFLLIKNGQEVKRHAGAMTLSDLNEFCFEV